MRDLYMKAIETARDVSMRGAPSPKPLTDETGEFVLRLDPGLGHPFAAIETRRIVIADDNHDIVDSLSMLLEIDGHKVYPTYDGVGAIRLAKALKPDFLLLDIAMPHINGYDVARQIRSRSWGSDMQIVAITGRGLPEDRKRAMHAGFDFHLTKPIALDVLSGILAARAAQASLIQQPDVR